MIDVQLLRKEPEKVKEGIKAKKADPALVDTFLTLDEEWRTLTSRVDALRREQKKLSTARDIEGGKKNKEDIKRTEERIAELEGNRNVVWRQIPNLPFDSVPRGNDESGNKVIRQSGEKPKFSAENGGFEPKDHLALGEALGIIDTKKAGVISGARFGYLLGGAALLEFALVQHTLKTLTSEAALREIANSIKPGYNPKPFIPVVPPVMIKPEVFDRMGRLEPKEERYHIPGDDVYLVGSAEHTLGPLHMDETLEEKNLPIRYIGFSTAFRREAGSYGKDTHGILRLHQFDKLEMESFTVPEDSRTEQDFIVGVQEYLVRSLELPYRVVDVCTGDMGGPDARQIDIEIWMPGQNKYRETHTSDLMTDYQARRLGTKVRRGDGKTEFVHMNDATAFAIGRTVIAIIENYQTADGKVRVPEVLREYVGKEIIG
jgi:seryl-tRNA synthetase